MVSDMYDRPIILVVTGIVIAIIQRRTRAEGARRSGFIGIRIPSTLTSDEAWRAGHQAASTPMLMSALTFIGGGILAAFIRAPSTQNVVVIGAVSVCLFLLFLSAVAANRCALSIRRSSGKKQNTPGRTG